MSNEYLNRSRRKRKPFFFPFLSFFFFFFTSGFEIINKMILALKKLFFSHPRLNSSERKLLTKIENPKNRFRLHYKLHTHTRTRTRNYKLFHWNFFSALSFEIFDTNRVTLPRSDNFLFYFKTFSRSRSSQSSSQSQNYYIIIFVEFYKKILEEKKKYQIGLQIYFFI